MKGVGILSAVGALALAGALASSAHAADTLNSDPSKILADRNQWAPQAVHKTFEWDAAKSRWGLKFDVQQQPGIATDWKNVQAGAYFKVTPTLRVGAGVALGEGGANTANLPAAQVAPPPRVQLETNLKF